MIDLKETRSATAQEWDNTWQNCEYATFFHSREWAEIWETYTNGRMRPQPSTIIFTDGKKVLLPFSCLKILFGLVSNYLSSPAGNYGGWITTDTLEAEHVVLIKNYVKKNFKNLEWRLNPYDNSLKDITLDIRYEDETDVLPLSSQFQEVMEKWSKSQRYEIRRGQKSGVFIEVARNLSHWEQYYEVYKDSIRRWGGKQSSYYRWELFKTIQQKNSDFIKLWLATHDGQVIAGVLCFYSHRQVVYWHGSALEKYFSLRPVYLLLSEVIKHACENNYLWFDFNPSGGHEGVKAFKRSFSTVQLKCPIVKNETKLNFLFRHFSKLMR